MVRSTAPAISWKEKREMCRGKIRVCARRENLLVRSIVSPRKGAMPRSLARPARAGDGIRTHDNDVGNVVLYQLSYTRALELLVGPVAPVRTASPRQGLESRIIGGPGRLTRSFGAAAAPTPPSIHRLGSHPDLSPAETSSQPRSPPTRLAGRARAWET